MSKNGVKTFANHVKVKKSILEVPWKEVSYKDTKGNNCSITMRIVYEVTERTIDKNGQILFGLISVGER